MLIQCHWQNRSNTSETKFIRQAEVDDNGLVHDNFVGDFANGLEAVQWAAKVFERLADELPDGWCPLVCDGSADCFVKGIPAQSCVRPS